MQTIGTWWMWAGFFSLVVVMVLLDLLLLKGGKEHRVSLREAAAWSAVWVALALLFNAALWWVVRDNAGVAAANEKALAFFTGYLVEKTLAVDNIFVWLMIFGYFKVPLELQRRVLLYGIVGALVLRTGMVFAGTWLVASFEWVLYVFGAFLLFTGVRMLTAREAPSEVAHNPVVNWLRNHYPVTADLRGERFLVRIDGVRHLTPLALTLVLVELSDVIFAVDSIPAILAFTTDPFIVLTSNVFAILGLRAMYFLLAGSVDRIPTLKPALSLILVFIGAKMLAAHWVKIPILASLGVVATILLSAIVIGLWRNRRPRPA